MGIADLGKPATTAMKERPSGISALGLPLSSLRPDLGTSEGLLELARKTGGPVKQLAEETIDPSEGFLSRIGSTLGSGLKKTIRALQVSSNVIAGVIDPNMSIGEAVRIGMVPSDVLIGDIKPESKIGKVGLFVGKLATDVLTDPLTYVTLGAGIGVFGVRSTMKIGGKATSLAGQDLLRKGIELGVKGGLSEDFVKQSFKAMMEKSPELAKQFLDQGGIKVFGNTILSGQRIRTGISTIPGMKAIDTASKPFRHAIGSLFSRDISATAGKLPREVIDVRQKYLDLGVVKSKEAVEKVGDIARANKLTWQETEIVNSAIEAGVKPADERLANVAQHIERELGIARKAEQRRGILKTELENYVPHILVDEPIKDIPFKPGLSAKLPFAKRRTIEGTIENINADFGREFFDPNIVRTTAQRLTASARATTAHDFYREMAEKFGTTAERASRGYVKSSVKGMENFYFHPAVEEMMKGFRGIMITDVGTQKFLKAFDTAQTLWKASVTSIFPAFHGRNAISNVFLNYLDIGLNAVNPARHAMAGQLLRMNGKATKLRQVAYGIGPKAVKAKEELVNLLSQNVLTDRYGHSWTFGELHGVIKNNRVAFGKEYTGFMDVRDEVTDDLIRTTTMNPEEKRKLLLKKFNPLSTEFKPFEIGRNIGNLVEQQARLVNFISNLRKTGDPGLAAQRTKQFLFDYDNLSPFEKMFMRRLVPFYTFTRKNIEAQVRALATTPGRIAAETKILTTLGDVFGGQQLTAEEEKLLPEWARRGITFTASRKGERINLVTGFELPIEQPFEAIINETYSGISPAIRLPFELKQGYDIFRGKPLGEGTNAEVLRYAPKVIKDAVGYVEVAWEAKDGRRGVEYVTLRPKLFHLLTNLPPTSRLLNTLKQVTDEDVEGSLRLLQQLIGIRPRPFDLEKLEASSERKLRQQLEEILDKAGVVYRFERAALSKTSRPIIEE